MLAPAASRTAGAQPSAVSPSVPSMPQTATPPPLLAATPSQPLALSIYSAWPPGSVDDYYLGQLAARFKEEHDYLSAIQVLHSANAAELGINIGDPPDVFAVNVGRELFTRWVAAGQMAPLDDVYEYAGLGQALPGGIL